MDHSLSLEDIKLDLQKLNDEHGILEEKAGEVQTRLLHLIESGELWKIFVVEVLYYQKM